MQRKGDRKYSASLFASSLNPNKTPTPLRVRSSTKTVCNAYTKKLDLQKSEAALLSFTFRPLIMAKSMDRSAPNIVNRDILMWCSKDTEQSVATKLQNMTDSIKRNKRL